MLRNKWAFCTEIKWTINYILIDMNWKFLFEVAEIKFFFHFVEMMIEIMNMHRISTKSFGKIKTNQLSWYCDSSLLFSLEFGYICLWKDKTLIRKRSISSKSSRDFHFIIPYKLGIKAITCFGYIYFKHFNAGFQWFIYFFFNSMSTLNI